MVKTRELELYALLAAARKWRSYLYGKRFVWYTDHKPLLWDEKNPSKKVANWLAELKEYDFEATYLKGEENAAADALSRYAQGVTRPALGVMALSRTKRKQTRVFVPKEEVDTVLRAWHDQRGHPGAQKTLEGVRERFYWPGLAGHVMKWCSSCDVCQKIRSGKKATAIGGEPTSQARRPFREITMDLVQIEDQQMLVIECMFSRFVETTMLPSKNAETVYKACCDLWLDRYGIPDLIRTDNGNEFSCLGAASFQLGFEWRRCSPHNPQSQGMCERANQSILNEITRLQTAQGVTVEDARRVGTRIYNAKRHKATGNSPYFLVFGQEPNDPDLVVEQKKHEKVNLKSKVSRWVSERTARDRRVFREALERDAQQKERSQQAGTGERFQVGDLVLIPRVNRLKTDPRRQGPYEVVQVRDGEVYRLKDLTNFRKPRILRHHRQLTKYVAREGEVWGQSETQITVQHNPGAGQAVTQRGRPRKQSSPVPGPHTPQGGGADQSLMPKEEVQNTLDKGAEEDGLDKADEEMEEDLDKQGQPLTQEKDEENGRREYRDRKKAEAKERRSEIEEEPRRSKRSNKGIPPLKYLMDLIGKWVALRSKTESRLQNWRRSHLPWKQEAVRRIAPFYLGGRSVGQAVK